MLQDIDPYRFVNDFSWVKPEPFDRVLIYRDNAVVVLRSNDDVLRFPSYKMLSEAGVVGPDVAIERTSSELPCRMDGKRLVSLLLFTVGNTAYFRCGINDSALDMLLGKSIDLVPVSMLRTYKPKYRVFAGMVGFEYHQWYDTRHFCGHCGAKMVHDLVERMVRCPDCGCMEFSRLFPAVIVGIVDRSTNKVLVSRYAGRSFKSYALIAGFCEMGETVEQTVHREVMEEVGLTVCNLRYYKSQPWPPSSSLLFGFFCELDGDATLRVDHHELEEAEWLDRGNLPKDEDYSLTREMMDVLRRGEETAYSLIGEEIRVN